MKHRAYFILILWVAVFTAGSQTSANNVVSTFSVPPFASDSTVAGIDGWKMISSGSPDYAVVRGHGNSQTGLLLRTHGIQKELEEKIEGKVTVTLVVQFGLVAEKGNASLFMIMPMIGVGVGSVPFGFNNEDSASEEPGGFFYPVRSLEDEEKIVTKRVYLLPRTEIYEGAKYTLSLAMDLDVRTFVLTITGKDANGNPVEVKSGEIAMDPSGRAPSGRQLLTGIRMASGLPVNTELFVESVTMGPSPQ